jgi:hypothetical protein
LRYRWLLEEFLGRGSEHCLWPGGGTLDVYYPITLCRFYLNCVSAIPGGRRVSSLQCFFHFVDHKIKECFGFEGRVLSRGIDSDKRKYLFLPIGELGDQASIA